MQKSMRLLHPIMPFITEEIFTKIKEFFPNLEESITISEFPKLEKKQIDEKIIKEMTLIQSTITTIRNLKKQVGLSPAKKVEILIKVPQENLLQLFANYSGYLITLANSQAPQVGVDIKKPSQSIAGVVENLEIFMPLSGMIDLDAEKDKLKKQLQKLEKEFKVISGKLSNQKFTSSAPAAIVEKEKGKYDEVKGKKDKVLELLKGLE